MYIKWKQNKINQRKNSKTKKKLDSLTFSSRNDLKKMQRILNEGEKFSQIPLLFIKFQDNNDDNNDNNDNHHHYFKDGEHLSFLCVWVFVISNLIDCFSVRSYRFLFRTQRVEVLRLKISQGFDILVLFSLISIWGEHLK